MSDTTTTTNVGESPAVQVGSDVLFTPGLDHALDRDANGVHVFEWQHVKNGPMRRGQPSAVTGDVAQMGQVGQPKQYDRAAGVLHTHGGHVLKPLRPKHPWAATVLAVKAGGKLDLSVQHPHGHKLEYLDVPYSAAGALHSWHLADATKGA